MKKNSVKILRSQTATAELCLYCQFFCGRVLVSYVVSLVRLNVIFNQKFKIIVEVE